MPAERFYRQLFGAGFFVFEPQNGYFQERTLQAMWREQFVDGDLRCADGQALEVVHPGVWNVESGPDFHDAVLFVGGESRRGPVEVHLRPEEWDRHGHQRDPAYQGVILHVVWQNPAGHGQYPAGVPLFCLGDYLDRPLDDVIDQVERDGYPYGRQVGPGERAEAMAAMSDGALTDLFQSLGIARILGKARDIAEEIAAEGLEHTVMRRFFDALGYKANREAFGRLAAALDPAAMAALPPATAQAVLFGAAGLLPDPTRDPVKPAYRDWVRELWDAWWPHRQAYGRIEWQRQRLRPANVPERRVMAAHLILQATNWALGHQLLKAFHEHEGTRARRRAVEDCLSADDRHWRHFYSFARDLDRPAALLGGTRRLDLVVNLAVPLFLADCFRRHDAAACRRGKDLLLALPRLQSNRVLKEAVQHFFLPPARARHVIVNACAQQGLIKLYRDLHCCP